MGTNVANRNGFCLPLRMNAQKKDKVGDRQRSMARIVWTLERMWLSNCHSVMMCWQMTPAEHWR